MGRAVQGSVPSSTSTARSSRATRLPFHRHRLRHFEIGPDEAARTLLAALRSTMTEEKLEPMRSAACATWPA
jgi:hypothetical protein